MPTCINRSDEMLSTNELLSIFDECDIDHSGTLTWSEFRKALSDKGFGLEFTEVLNLC